MSTPDTSTTDTTTTASDLSTTSTLPYVLLATSETVQVFSTELVVPSIRATIRTKKSRIIGTLTIATELFNTGGGVLELNSFTANLELILADQRVSAVTAAPDLDESNLLEDMLTITVAYKPSGSAFPPLTVDIRVPYADVRGTTSLTTGTFTASPVETAIAAAYNQLRLLAGA